MSDVLQTIARGTTYYGSSATIDTSDYGTSVALEGQTKWFKDAYKSTPTTLNSQLQVLAVLVRNVSGITLYGGMAVAWDSGYFGRRVDGYTCYTAGQVAGVVDDWLGTNGVRNGDLFWLIVRGPCLVRTPISAGATNVWTEGDPLYAVTAAASTANTTGGTTADESGHLQPWTGLTCTSTSTTTGGYDGEASIIVNRVGRVLSAATTANTNAEKRIWLSIPEWA